MKTELTIQQSQRLIEIGVDPSKASEVKEFDDELSRWIHRSSPIFTLTDILSLLPKELTKEFENGEIVRFQLHLYIYEGKWCVGYGENERPKDKLFDVDPLANLYFASAPEFIDALFELLVWSLQNHPDKIKKL